MKPFSLLLLGAVMLYRDCSSLGIGKGFHPIIRDDAEKRALLQDLVTWDDNSLFVHGERVMVFSGEFHPFRLPVPSLWIDVFQKIKALGLNCVSFYVHWALLEGKPGEYVADGVLALEPFFQAAKDTGIYLIARPGPYINAEVSGGGFPGWLHRIKGHLRTNDSDYLTATDNYMANVGKAIAKAQITNGGPIILVQPENEYTAGQGVVFPNGPYMQYVEDQLRKAGVVVPLINNDAYPGGHNAPGTGVGQVDIYGHDSYPLGFDCANPYTWPSGALPTNFYTTHLKQSPKTPFSINEFQGGSFDPPGGPGYEKCAVLLNNEFERVFYKNNFASGVKIFNIYMIFGGTNLGNLGHPSGYTSYDYGAAIAEDRTITREKYSELKLEAQFIKVTPGYLVASPEPDSTVNYSSNTNITVTAVQGHNGSFFVVRHSSYESTDAENYTLILPTAVGNLTIPQLGGLLTLNDRDSKIHVSDYPMGDTLLLYSTAEVFTWRRSGNETILVVYGSVGELHELAVQGGATGKTVEGSGVTFKSSGNSTIAQWTTSTDRKIVQIDSLYVYLLNRNLAYGFWVPETTASSSVIVNGGYLVRSARIAGDTLSFRADFNTSTVFEVIAVPHGISKLQINGAAVPYATDDAGSWVTNISIPSPRLYVPDLKALNWTYIDSLPEISPNYDDSAWPMANHTVSNNTLMPLQAPVSLYASDYGFHTGTLLFRGHFVAAGNETQLQLQTIGGEAFAYSVWLNATHLGSWTGSLADTNDSTWQLPPLEAGRSYTITVLLDNMGLDENGVVGADQMKRPRGIIRYALSSPATAPITWKLTGNLGGERYADRARGPLNEGGLWAERQGYHLPAPPVERFAPRSPLTGLDGAGVGFFTAKLPLSYPSEQYDIPVAFVFGNASAGVGVYRTLLYVNGFQFGRYTSNMGPQAVFPVPEGILNHGGDNWISVALWALEEKGAKLDDFYLQVGHPVLTGREKVVIVDAPAWEERKGAY